MILPPIVITNRLMAGVRIGVRRGDGDISIGYSDRPGTEGRVRYEYWIDLDDGTEYHGDDLQSGCQGGSLQEGLQSLLSFLDACGEAYGYALRTRSALADTENGELFPTAIAEWCYQNSDELGMLACVLEETPDLIWEE